MKIKMLLKQRGCNCCLAFICGVLLTLNSCSISQKIEKQSRRLLNDSAVASGHTGISIYEPATGKYWFQHNADKYFIPASNTKLLTLYAGLRFLGDSLIGAYYRWDQSHPSNTLQILGNADPTFLHPDYKVHPVYNFLKSTPAPNLTLCERMPLKAGQPVFEALGNGWAWNDFNSNYMVERSFFPLYGNLALFRLKDKNITVTPSLFSRRVNVLDKNPAGIDVERLRGTNFYTVTKAAAGNNRVEVPMKMGFDDPYISVEDSLLVDTLKRPVGFAKLALADLRDFKPIYSQPTDSMLTPMMHRSDNFFAEQTLLMVSHAQLGYMHEGRMIDSILRSSLRDLPQRPKWVDGSGLSRYNLCSPHSFVALLVKMKDSFGINRMQQILPTGGEGTLGSYYKTIAGKIFAKTGTLSNNCALSGYLITRKGRLLVFSILNNNYITGATPVRRAVESFLLDLYNKY